MRGRGDVVAGAGGVAGVAGVVGGVGVARGSRCPSWGVCCRRAVVVGHDFDLDDLR